MTAFPRSFSSRSVSVFVVTTALCLTLLVAIAGQAETLIPGNTTMVVFSDRPLDAGQWAALVGELHKGQADLAAFVPIMRSETDFDVLQGSDVRPGLVVQKTISVFLKGDCALMPRSRTFVQGALGWVKEVRGRIEPFVYVDCERIVEMLGPLALGMHRDRRDTVMGEAIARVILHEWVHIATQQARHGKSGITQSKFQVSDLLADDEQLHPRSR